MNKETLFLAAVEMTKMTIDGSQWSQGSPAWNQEFYKILGENYERAVDMVNQLPSAKGKVTSVPIHGI